MKLRILLLAIVVACGGGGKKAPAPPPAADKKPAEDKPPEPEKPAEPPVPKMAHAKAALTPSKGAKVQAATVSFAQNEGEDTNVTSDDFEGLKPGTYHLVIHDGESCDKAGPPWKQNVELTLKISKDTKQIDEKGVKLMIGGVAPIVGHVLALHDDKKGKPNKMLACGAIEAVGDQ